MLIKVLVGLNIVVIIMISVTLQAIDRDMEIIRARHAVQRARMDACGCP